ncbi:MAG TPA: hypothetical protein VGN93_28735 [Shinella sp.]|uniref:hypothetical protein n=1 Tax=Shinella sp. TaxID=1870904 RepID=UPI002E1069B3|nr:hypothetical protein [Shinella sp.]
MRFSTAKACFYRNQKARRRILPVERRGNRHMWERFSTSGLAGSYLDDLLADGVKARMEFRPRRAFDPHPFLVSLDDEGEAEAFFTRPIDGSAIGRSPRFEP